MDPRSRVQVTTGLAILRELSQGPHLKLGVALDRASLQQYQVAMRSKTASDFRQRINRALYLQKRASVSFKKLGHYAGAMSLRSHATEAFLAYWLAKDSTRKKRHLERSWNLAWRSLQGFRASKNYSEYAETYKRFSIPVGLSVECDGNVQSRVRKLKEATEAGRQALRIVELIGNKQELARTMARVSFFVDSSSEDLTAVKRRSEYEQEASAMWEEAIGISRQASLCELSHPLAGLHQMRDPDLNLRLCEEALRIVKPKRDHFAIGRLLDHLAKWSNYAALSSESSENPAVARKMHLDALHYSEEAVKHYDTINFTSLIGGVMWVHSPYTEHFQDLAKHENNRASRRLLLEKAVRSSPELIRLAKRSGSPRVLIYAFHLAMKSENLLAQNEAGRRRKRELLQRALSHSILASERVRQVNAPRTWNLATTLWGVAEARSRLAEFEEKPRHQTRLLQGALLNMDECVSITTAIVKTFKSQKQPSYYDHIGRYQRAYGDVLLRLAALTKREEYLRKAASHYKAAAEYYGRIPRYDRIAESYWKSAKAYDRLQAHLLAAESFTLASSAYKKLGDRIPTLKKHSQNYASYLGAWSKVEQARNFHARTKYGLAADSYNSAAQLLRLAGRWSFLAPYFSAWSKLESGEDLSKNSSRKSAVRAFHDAARLFSESRESLRERLAQLDQPEEKILTESLASAPRTEYAQARAILEDAMEAESEEDYELSIEKFGLASVKLKEVSDRSEDKQDRTETAFLSVLCKAWQLCNEAESENSTRPLKEALVLFEKASDMNPSHVSAELALGHVAFCNGLIACRRYATTLDQASYDEAAKQLDLAATYYLESGFKTASEHSAARKLLLSALSQINQARNEHDQQRKSVRYRMASSLLQESTMAFQRARQPKKRERVRALRKQAWTESKVASDLSEILLAALNPAANVAFNVLAQGREKAVGLDRFERGDIEIHLTNLVLEQELGRNVEIRVEVTNTGNQPIRLTRLEDVVPEGAEPEGLPEGWGVEGRSIIMPPKRTGILQTETVTVTIRPKKEGLLRICPKAIFVDASGVQSERSVEPKIVATSRIMDFLSKAFLEDYASKRLALPNSGWRTLMETVRELKIPRSHVYGEPRYGRSFGSQLETLLKSSLVEYRIFPGERGRGGNVTRVRVLLDNEDVRKHLDDLALPSTGPFSRVTNTATSNDPT